MLKDIAAATSNGSGNTATNVIIWTNAKAPWWSQSNVLPSTQTMNITNDSVALYEGCAAPPKTTLSLKHSSVINTFLNSSDSKCFQAQIIKNFAPLALFMVSKLSNLMSWWRNDLKKRLWKNTEHFLVLASRSSACFLAEHLLLWELWPLLVILFLLLRVMSWIMQREFIEKKKARRWLPNFNVLCCLRKEIWIEEKCYVHVTNSKKDGSEKQNRERVPLHKRWRAILMFFNLSIHSASAHVKLDYQNRLHFSRFKSR